VLIPQRSWIDFSPLSLLDAFWGPRYWAGYDPASSSSSSSMGSASPSYLEIDTHQYYAFAPLINLPHATILESVCNVSRMLKSTDRTRVPATIVGEWSLQTGEP
jgi:glucan 1,3-beta-glucosidase